MAKYIAPFFFVLAVLTIGSLIRSTRELGRAEQTISILGFEIAFSLELRRASATAVPDVPVLPDGAVCTPADTVLVFAAARPTAEAP